MDGVLKRAKMGSFIFTVLHCNPDLLEHNHTSISDIKSVGFSGTICTHQHKGATRTTEQVQLNRIIIHVVESWIYGQECDQCTDNEIDCAISLPESLVVRGQRRNKDRKAREATECEKPGHWRTPEMKQTP